MSWSSYLAITLLAMFFVYITVRGQLPAYLSLLFWTPAQSDRKRLADEARQQAVAAEAAAIAHGAKGPAYNGAMRTSRALAEAAGGAVAKVPGLGILGSVLKRAPQLAIANELATSGPAVIEGIGEIPNAIHAIPGSLPNSWDDFQNRFTTGGMYPEGYEFPQNVPELKPYTAPSLLERFFGK